MLGRRAYPARTGAAIPGSHAQASGRTRANSAWAANAETAATHAPVKASKTQWLPVAIPTNVSSGPYQIHIACAQPWRAIRTMGIDSISAKQTCIEGTAAYGLKSASTDAAETPVKFATLSVKPSSGNIRGGAVGYST